MIILFIVQPLSWKCFGHLSSLDPWSHSVCWAYWAPSPHSKYFLAWRKTLSCQFEDLLHLLLGFFFCLRLNCLADGPMLALDISQSVSCLSGLRWNSPPQTPQKNHALNIWLPGPTWTRLAEPSRTFIKFTTLTTNCKPRQIRLFMDAKIPLP